MAQVRIFSSKKQSFFGKVAKLDSRAKRLGLEPVTVRPLDETGVEYSPCGRYAESWQTYYVEGPVVRLNGYQLVGVLKAVGDYSGNTVSYRNENHDLHRFISSTNVCDHCGIARERNNTFIVYNSETGEYSQLGSTCVLSFVGGDLQTDPEAIARFLDGLNDLLLDDEEREDIDGDSIRESWGRFHGYVTTRVVAIALSVVEKSGRYISVGEAKESVYGRNPVVATSREVSDLYDTVPGSVADLDYSTKAQELIDFCIENGHEIGAGWAADVVTCLKSEVTKEDHFGLVVSSVRLREIILERRELARKVEGMPEQQDVHLEAPERKRAKGIDLWFNGSTPIESDYGTRYLNRFVAANGAAVLWFGGEDLGDDFSKGDQLNVDAYVKSHDDHPRYGKQTLINRVKVND